MKQIETVKDILELPWVSTDELNLLPEDAGVYFVMISGSVIYIGKSQNLFQRWIGHHRLEQILEMGDADIHYLLVEASAAGMIEAEMIDRFFPLLNNTRSPVNPSERSFESSSVKNVSQMDILIDRLSEIRGRSISLSCFYKWLSVCQIPAKKRSRNGYSDDEIMLLEQLAEHLRDGYDYDSFSLCLPNQSS